MHSFPVGPLPQGGAPSGCTTSGREVADRFGLVHRSARAVAVAAFDEAVVALVAHRPTSAAALDRALAHDPDLVAAHALHGFGGVMLARAETVAAARGARAAARAAAGRRGTTAGEAVLLAALDAAIEGRLHAAAALLERHLRRDPHALLFIKLCCSLRFLAGDAAGMRRLTSRVLPSWRPDRAGYGYVLGCHAFALEETGDLDAAERAGREAVGWEPHDAWGLHAVAHVYEMSGRPEAGIAWIEGTRPDWQGCNNFAFHLAWHLALFHLEKGRPAIALELYDREIRAAPSEDFRDIANAASLLWRLRQEGVGVGDRWAELAAIARRRRHDTTLVFASLHRLLALAATGDSAAAADALLALRRAAASPGDQARAAAEVGLPLARLLLAAEGAPDPAEAPAADRIAAALPLLGGSHAQRDVFVRILLDRAAAAGDAAMLDRLLAARRTRRAEDRFAARLAA